MDEGVQLTRQDVFVLFYFMEWLLYADLKLLVACTLTHTQLQSHPNASHNPPADAQEEPWCYFFYVTINFLFFRVYGVRGCVPFEDQQVYSTWGRDHIFILEKIHGRHI